MVTLLKVNEVSARVAMSRMTLFRRVKAGQFPPPLRVGKSIYWTDTAVEQWIADLSTEAVA